MTVLIVEDDHFYAQCLKEALADRGVDSLVVTSAQAALQCQSNSFDAAVIDIMLPNDPEQSGISDEESRGGHLAGVAVARRLRKSTGKLPTVLISGGSYVKEAHDWASAQQVPFVHKDAGRRALMYSLGQIGVLDGPRTPRAFIVHGHDELALRELKDYLQNTLRWQEPLVLREQPNAGRSLIEKFEASAEQVDCVFVLLTPDDTIRRDGTNDEKRRSRQNVIFEMGYFYAQFGRQSGRVIALYKGPNELPSDIQGIAWINIENGIVSAGEDIRREVGVWVAN